MIDASALKVFSTFYLRLLNCLALPPSNPVSRLSACEVHEKDCQRNLFALIPSDLAE